MAILPVGSLSLWYASPAIWADKVQLLEQGPKLHIVEGAFRVFQHLLPCLCNLRLQVPDDFGLQWSHLVHYDLDFNDKMLGPSCTNYGPVPININ